MTQKEQFNAEETRRFIFARDGGVCQHCGEWAQKYGTPQLAHLVPQSKMNLSKYGKAFIHDPINMKLTCSLRCNAAVSIAGHPVKIEQLYALWKSSNSGTLPQGA